MIAVAAAVMVLAIAARGASAQAPTTTATAYEGARLIAGDGTVIDDSAFVVENGHFAAAGRRGAVAVPAGAVRVDLAGKTVMPTLVDLHGHFGFQNVAAGTMSKDTFTRDNLVDHLERLAFHGVGAVVGVGDLVDRSDMHGGRTGWGDTVVRVRDEVIPGAALFKTAGAGMAWPGAGAQGDPSRVDVAYPVTTPQEARAAVQDYVRIKPVFIKIWVDDRGGRIKTLTPPLYGAILDEAHRFGVPVAVHNVRQADAKELIRDGVEGFMHVPVREGEVADDELVGLIKDRVARGDRPRMWMTLSLITAWLNTTGGGHPDLLDDPLLAATYAPAQIEKYWGEPLRRMTPERLARARASFQSDAVSAMRVRAAGIRVVGGTDTGQSRFLIGYFNHIDLESMVAAGMTPLEAITAATRDGADIAGFNTGLVAAGRNADFMVLDADPVTNIGNTRRIARVFLRGEEVPRAAMAARWQRQFRQEAAN